MQCLPENCARYVPRTSAAFLPRPSVVLARRRRPAGGALHSCCRRPLPSSDMVSSSAVLTTPRLLLRKFGAEDAARLPQLCGAFEVSGMCMKVPHPYSEDDARYFLEHVCTAASSLTLAIVRREDDELMGCVSLDAISEVSASLGYWLGRAFWGQGFATEAARAIVAHGFSSLGLERVHGAHFVENPASGAVMRKLGFLATGDTAIARCMARGGVELPTVLLRLARTSAVTGAAEPTVAAPPHGTRRKRCRLCFSDAYVRGVVRQALEERGWQVGEEVRVGVSGGLGLGLGSG